MELPSHQTLRDLYFRLKRQPEQHAEELKSFALTEANAREHLPKLVKTIAGIANKGESFGFVVCAQSGPATEAMIDGAKLDDLINRFVHPRVNITLARHEIDGSTADFVIIPKSRQRPHLLRLSDGSYCIPFRGIANNTTAARAELDDIYRDQTIELIRQAIPGVTIGEPDNVGAYLDSIGYGTGPTSEPQLAVVVATTTVPRPVIRRDSLLYADALRNDVTTLALSAINANPDHSQWFSLYNGISPVAMEDYADVRQVGAPPEGKREAYLCGARIYETGAVTYSSVLWPADERGAVPIAWFKRMMSATLLFAHLAYEHFDPAIDELSVRALLTRAEGVRLSETIPVIPALLGSMTVPEPNLLIPTRQGYATTRLGLKDDILTIVDELARVLKTKYTFPH